MKVVVFARFQAREGVPSLLPVTESCQFSDGASLSARIY